MKEFLAQYGTSRYNGQCDRNKQRMKRGMEGMNGIQKDSKEKKRDKKRDVGRGKV